MKRANETATVSVRKSTTAARQQATISDVARLAGVSIKTVSRVANKEPNVRDATRSHVQDAIDALDYQANPYARYLSFLRWQADKGSPEQSAEDTNRSG